MAEATQTTTSTPPVEPPGLPEAEWARLFNQHPVEVVDGEILEMTPADSEHGWGVRSLFRSLDRFSLENQLGEVFPEGIPYVLDGNRRKQWVKGSRVPDVSFIARARFDAYVAEFGRIGPYYLAPDLAVEFVSVHDTYTDVNRKVADYLRFGVRLVWVIDREERTIRAFMPDNPNGILLTESDTLTGDPVLPGWSAPVKQVLDGDIPT